MRRVRLLIYDGPGEWIELNKARDFVQLKKELGVGKSITSVEVGDESMTVEEILSIVEARDGLR